MIFPNKVCHAGPRTTALQLSNGRGRAYTAPPVILAPNRNARRFVSSTCETLRRTSSKDNVGITVDNINIRTDSGHDFDIFEDFSSATCETS